MTRSPAIVLPTSEAKLLNSSHGEKAIFRGETVPCTLC